MHKSYVYLLNIKYKNNLVLFTSIFVLIITIIFICSVEKYDTYNTYAIYQNKMLVCDIPIDNSDNITLGKYFKYDKHNYFYKIKNISNINEQNYINYQTYYLISDIDLKNNEVVKITFYYKKEKIVKKIIKAIF